MIRMLLMVNAINNSWDISKAIFTRGITIFDQTQTVTGITFSLDGTKMYVVHGDGPEVFQYNLGIAWNIGSALYSVTHSENSIDSTLQGVYFSPDGTKMYTIGSSTDSVHQSGLSTPWNIATAVWVRTLSISAKDTSPQDVVFSSDGTKMYIAGDVSNSIHQYTLSTAWNISTAVFLQSLSVSTKENDIRGLYFSPDGTRMYITGATNQAVNQYILSTAWNISTAAWLRTLAVSTLVTKSFGVAFSTQGEYMYVLDNSAGTYQVLQYTM